ncbi:hypothetical protein SDC9_174171 [bioreactor metagenome]|uniref:Uncharacterized protein n=1 Tax=bioreactor metagenome TaxID=1076179 RepID=A0A645GKK6_9ZZZZ
MVAFGMVFLARQVNQRFAGIDIIEIISIRRYDAIRRGLFKQLQHR